MKELDSRVQKLTAGWGGVSKPIFGQAGQRVYCANCGKEAGWATENLDGIIYICRDCEKVHGIPPLRRADIPEPKEF